MTTFHPPFLTPTERASVMSGIAEELVILDEAGDMPREAWNRLMATTSLATATQAPMAVYGDSEDWATALPSQSVDIPLRRAHQPEGDGPEAGPSAHIQEPDFIAQVQQDPALHREWWKVRAAEASNAGCTFARCAYHPQDATIALFEGWKVRPDDQGEPRWQLVRLEA